MRTWKFVVGAAALAVAAPLTATAAPLGVDRASDAPAGAIDTRLIPSSQSNAPVKVIVQLTEDPVAVVEAKQQRKLSEAEKTKVRDKIKGQQKGVKAKAQASGGKVLAEMQDAYNGVKVQIAGDKVTELAATEGVLSVHAVTVHERTNAVSVPYLGAPQVWESQGLTGKGVKVAIIDTGVDYTHSDFAGPGTVEAYKAADATDTQPADPALFGPNAKRVKGGWDFVGDSYNANDPKSVPAPDSNPLDCQGHGSHVAGTAAGGGVNADGSAYTGPYDTSVVGKDWKIGPGVAPEADIYAYRVFGCSGSTDVTTEAIDRAVKDGVDVINMSLGSSYGAKDDTSAVAASNAVGAGVVVVASAGNSGPNPYLTGSPGTGPGVVSVAANDSTASFPGAEITLADGTKIPAVNANGLTPIPAGPFKIVALKDIAGTPENESLGCSTEAYTKNGVVAGGNQLAVSVRGTCARVAKAVWAQKAGAAAAAMVDTSANFPPYEGAILENPDNGEKYQVTIPFLGVRGVLGSAATDDGDKLVAAHGTAATLAEKDLPNPAFTQFASFSSGGPRTGDSGLKANVTAPGVSTSSAAVGTGSDASIKSGTSMAAPHVAGVAALTVQAHPNWSATDVAQVIVNTADPSKVGNYKLTLGGAGQVDLAQSLSSQVSVGGDAFVTHNGTYLEPTLSYGFFESTTSFTGTKKITLTNHGTSPVTYQVSNEATPQTRPATVSFSATSVTVPAGGTATVDVTLNVPMGSVGSALASRFAFYEASGNVLLKSASGDLRVPYLLVPRASANVKATMNGNLNPQTGANGSVGVRSTINLELSNVGGALATTADVYQLGLTDPQGDATAEAPGVDLRAIGVQSFDDEGDKLLVFAVNSWNRYSNAAAQQTQVVLDTNRDGKADYVVYATDSGLVRTENTNGLNEVFVYDVAAQSTFAAGFYAVSPTDNSTVLLPVVASDLGLTAEAGTFSYTGEVSSIVNEAAKDAFSGVATYNPWKPALENGQSVDLAKGAKKAKLKVAVDAAAFAEQQPEGLMVVALDNASGESEAILLQRR